MEQEKLVPAWLKTDTHHKFGQFKAKQKHRSADVSINYLLHFHKLVEKQDKALFEKLKFNLN